MDHNSFPESQKDLTSKSRQMVNFNLKNTESLKKLYFNNSIIIYGRYKTQVTGHRSQVTGQGTGHRSQVTGYRSGHKSQVTGHRAQVTGHRA